MSRLISCEIGGINAKRDDMLRTLFIQDIAVAFTPTEYRLLLLLIEKQFLPDKRLMGVFTSNSTNAHAEHARLEKHLENIKSKLRPTGLCIRRIHRYGYSLMPEATVH